MMKELVMESLKRVMEIEEIEAEVNLDTWLFGTKGLLDSLALVAVVVDVEESIEERYDVSLTLADEKAMSQKRSPFLTPRTLAEYAEKLLKEIQ